MQKLLSWRISVNAIITNANHFGIGMNINYVFISSLSSALNMWPNKKNSHLRSPPGQLLPFTVYILSLLTFSKLQPDISPAKWVHLGATTACDLGCTVSLWTRGKSRGTKEGTALSWTWEQVWYVMNPVEGTGSWTYRGSALTGGGGQVLPLPVGDASCCLFLSGAVCALSGTCFRVLSSSLQTPF